MAVKRVKLSETLISVFETDVLEQSADPEEFFLDSSEALAIKLLAAAFTGTHLLIPANPKERDLMRDWLVDQANFYDDVAEYKIGPEDPKFARRAAKGLTTLSLKLLQG